MNKTVIITGGPGSGKTTLLSRLKDLGFRTCPEVPRQLIEESLEKGSELLPWIDLEAFAGACYEEMIRQRDSADDFPLFVDRAVGDIIAYMNIGDLDGWIYRSGAVEGYCETVFLLKPDRGIYIQDEVRPHSYVEALAIHEEIRRVYQSLGFKLAELSLKEPDEMADELLKILGFTSRRIKA